MKKGSFRFLYIAFILAVFVSSCAKEKIDQPDFDVKTNTTTFKVGEPVTFTFSGNPDYLTFYSGQKGFAYDKRNRTSELGTSQILKFTSAVATGTQTDNLKVMASTDFNGSYTAPDIAKATWTDITARGKLSTGAALASGSVSLNDFAAVAKPFYLAFYYYAPQNTLKPRNWTISALTITNTLEDGTVSNVVANFAAAGFKNVTVQNTSRNWNMTTTNMVMTAGNAGEPVSEAWAVSAPVDLKTVAIPDYGAPIKSIDVLLPSYTYTYTAAGTYKVVFVAANANVKDTRTTVKEMTIVVQN